METLEQQRRRASKPLLWIGIGSIIMAFAGMTSGYVVSRTTLVANEQWMTFALPPAFMYSTIVIVLSSLVFWWGKRSYASGNSGVLRPVLSAVLILGLVFLYLQGQAWNQLMAESIFFAGAASHPSGSWVYALFLFHAAHVLGGIIALVVMLIRSLRGRYTVADHNGVELVAIYWHFVDLLWVYLYVFLSVIR
jgi:cytochrome c oxidase subunit 3